MHDAYRTLVSRGILKEYDASGSQHLAKISGLRSEELAAVPRMQQFGQSSNPPLGSHVLFTRLGGASDRAVILGIDNANLGPRDLTPGDKAIYDAHGNVISLVSSAVRIVASADLTINAAGAITLTSGGLLTHNGKNIGSTHIHSGVLSGPSNTSVPV